jgi:FkbM family methyltransferase
MLIIKKIKDLRHVPFTFKWRLLLYQLRKELHLPYRERDHQLNIFLTIILLQHNAYLKDEHQDSYTADFYPENKFAYTVTLRKHPSSDCDVFNEVFTIKEYQPLVDLITANLDQQNCHALNILDAGANIGVTSIFLHTFFPHANFIVVEPDSENFDILKKNIHQADIENCLLVQGGIWDRDTNLEIVRDFRDKKDWSIRVVESAVYSGLKGYSINTLMEMGNFSIIDIFKIDIEGAEKRLFEDHRIASDFLSKTKFLAIEIHDEFDCRSDVEQSLRENNFDFFHADKSLFAVNRNLVPTK